MMMMMLFLVPSFFLVFSICALYDNVRSNVTPIHTRRLQWVKFTPFQLMLELFATFPIPQVEDADLIASLSDSRGAGLWYIIIII